MLAREPVLRVFNRRKDDAYSITHAEVHSSLHTIRPEVVLQDACSGTVGTPVEELHRVLEWFCNAYIKFMRERHGIPNDLVTITPYGTFLNAEDPPLNVASYVDEHILFTGFAGSAPPTSTEVVIDTDYPLTTKGLTLMFSLPRVIMMDRATTIWSGVWLFPPDYYLAWILQSLVTLGGRKPNLVYAAHHYSAKVAELGIKVTSMNTLMEVLDIRKHPKLFFCYANMGLSTTWEVKE